MTDLYWPTTLAGSVGQCRATAVGLRDLGQRVRVASLVAERQRGVAGWHGRAEASAGREVATTIRELEAVADRTQDLAEALADFVRLLGGVEEQLAAARAVATATGLRVSGAGFFASGGHEAAVMVRAARAREGAAHEGLGHALVSVRDGGRAERLVTSAVSGVLRLPPTGGDRWDHAGWALGLPGSVAALPTERVKAQLALVATAATQSTDATVRRAASAVDRLAPRASQAVKELGVVGDVVTVGLAGREQWRADADDASMTEAERIGRTTVRAGIEGLATVGGAVVVGGLLSPIPGGTFVGSAIGGWAGQRVGGLVADVAVTYVDDALVIAEAVGDTAQDAADDVVGAARGVADAAGEAADAVADRLCAWI